MKLDEIKYSIFINKEKLRLICWLIFAFLLAVGCSTIKYIPIETKTEIIQKDSVVFRDSIIYIPKERVVDIVPVYDTLKLSIEAAEARSWIDTSYHCLRGEIQAKNSIQKEVSYRDKTVIKDSIITKEIPVPYKVEVEKKYIPKIYKWAMAWSIVSILILILFFVIKLKKLTKLDT